MSSSRFDGQHCAAYVLLPVHPLTRLDSLACASARGTDAIGGVVYDELEGWALLDTTYFLTVTVTTVGYGDMCPETDEGKVRADLAPHRLQIHGELLSVHAAVCDSHHVLLRHNSCFPPLHRPPRRIRSSYAPR